MIQHRGKKVAAIKIKNSLFDYKTLFFIVNCTHRTHMQQANLRGRQKGHITVYDEISECAREQHPPL